MKLCSMMGLTAVAILLVPLMAGESFAQAQTQQINYGVSNTTGFGGWTGACCYPGSERCGNNAPFTLSWPDQIQSQNVRIEVRYEWGTCCIGQPTLAVTLNTTPITPDTQPGGLNSTPAADCTCRQTSFQASGNNYTLPSTNSYVPGGTNTLSINFSNNSGCNLCLANNSAGWCAQVTIVGLNQAPAAPTNLHQAAISGGSAQPVGFVSDTTIFFRATVTDPNAGNTVGLEAEILPSASTFGANPTGTVVSTPTGSYVASGSVAEVALNFTSTNLPSGSYKWRVRAKDNIGAAGPWVVFDAATIHFSTDFTLPLTPAGPFAPNGAQLVFFEPTATVTFEWGPASDPGSALPVDYRLEISKFANFSVTVHDSVVATQSQNVFLTAFEDPYFWRVSAVDAAGNTSAPAGPQVFELAWTIPVDKHDPHANCGASTVAGPAWTLALAAAAMLLALTRRRRS